MLHQMQVLVALLVEAAREQASEPAKEFYAALHCSTQRPAYEGKHLVEEIIVVLSNSSRTCGGPQRTLPGEEEAAQQDHHR